MAAESEDADDKADVEFEMKGGGAGKAIAANLQL